MKQVEPTATPHRHRRTDKAPRALWLHVRSTGAAKVVSSALAGRRVTWIATLALVATMAGCSDSSGPSFPDIGGAWAYSVASFTAAGVQGSCSVSGVRLTIAQNGETFSGSTSGGRSSCTDGSGVDVDTFVIRDGTVSANGSISFDLDDSSWSHTGTVGGNSMTGTTSLRAGSSTFTGTFTATR